MGDISAVSNALLGAARYPTRANLVALVPNCSRIPNDVKGALGVHMVLGELEALGYDAVPMHHSNRGYGESVCWQRTASRSPSRRSLKLSGLPIPGRCLRQLALGNKEGNSSSTS